MMFLILIQDHLNFLSKKITGETEHIMIDLPIMGDVLHEKVSLRYNTPINKFKLVHLGCLVTKDHSQAGIDPTREHLHIVFLP